MLFALIVMSGIASVALACWLTAEIDLRELERDLEAAEHELAAAAGQDGPGGRAGRAVLHAIEGGDA